MAITASSLVALTPLADGRRYVTEQHTDQDGLIHRLTYLAGALDNLQATLTARATQLFADLVDRELERNLQRILEQGSAAQLTFRYCTAGQMRAYGREAFRTLTRVDACFMAQFLFTLTDTQLKTLFSMNDTQLASLKTRLQAKATLVPSLQAAAGE